MASMAASSGSSRQAQHTFQADVYDSGIDTDTLSDAGSHLSADDLPGETHDATYNRYF